MRYLSMIRLDEKRGLAPSEQLMQDMGKLIEEMTRKGQLISTAGLRPTAEGVRVRLRGGRLSTTDGPFAETKEVIGGYAILEAKSMQEAVELTKALPADPRRRMGHRVRSAPARRGRARLGPVGTLP